MRKKLFYLCHLLILLLIGAACSSEPNEIPTSTGSENPTAAVQTENNGEGYPLPQANVIPTAAYPIEESLSSLSDTEVILPETPADRSTVGGILARRITDEGFEPIAPVQLTLGEIVRSDAGDPLFLESREEGLKAELYNAGVFVFPTIDPGTYGLVVDLGFGEFPVTDEDGNPLLFTVEAGEAKDLGLLEVTLPGE